MQLQVLLFVFTAMILGGLLGFEREIAGKPAGLRTHMLIAGAACLLVSISDSIITGAGVGGDLIRADPLRIVEAVITGITFLGAGTIIRSRDGDEVEGLTTAASLFFAVSIGIAVALSLFLLAIGATLLTLMVLRMMKWAEQSIHTTKQRQGKDA